MPDELPFGAVSASEVEEHARQAFGASCEVESLRDFVAGVRKQTFVARLREPSLRVLLIVWQNLGQYFPEREAAGFEETQSDVVAPELFGAHTEQLLALGILVPRLLYSARLASGHAMAFVEWIDGVDFEGFVREASREERLPVLERLRAAIECLHSVERDFPGPLSPERPQLFVNPEDESMAVAEVELTSVAGTHPEVAAIAPRILDHLKGLRARIKPRSSFRLLHGELDPSHILIRRSDHGVFLVDIEGVRFGDVEAEHAFLRWRFAPEDYALLDRGDLDPVRLAFYMFRMHVSLVYAGSRLLMGGHPARELATDIFVGNLAAVRAALDMEATIACGNLRPAVGGTGSPPD